MLYDSHGYTAGSILSMYNSHKRLHVAQPLAEAANKPYRC